jgi:hypothetical protein
MANFQIIALDSTTPQLRAPGASDGYTLPRPLEMPLGTAYGALYLDASKVVTSVAGTNGQVLVAGASGPTWASVDGGTF